MNHKLREMSDCEAKQILLAVVDGYNGIADHELTSKELYLLKLASIHPPSGWRGIEWRIPDEVIDERS